MVPNDARSADLSRLEQMSNGESIRFYRTQQSEAEVIRINEVWELHQHLQYCGRSSFIQSFREHQLNNLLDTVYNWK